MGNWDDTRIDWSGKNALCKAQEFPFFKTMESNYVKCSSTRDTEAEIPSLKPLVVHYVMKFSLAKNDDKPGVWTQECAVLKNFEYYIRLRRTDTYIDYMKICCH